VSIPPEGGQGIFYLSVSTQRGEEEKGEGPSSSRPPVPSPWTKGKKTQELCPRKEEEKGKRNLLLVRRGEKEGEKKKKKKEKKDIDSGKERNNTGGGEKGKNTTGG